MVEATRKVILDGLEGEFNGFLRVARFNRSIRPRYDRTFAEPWRFQTRECCPLAGPVEPYCVLKEPIIGDRLCISSGLPRKEGFLKDASELFLGLFWDPYQDMVEISCL